jgi:hypothetical protein
MSVSKYSVPHWFLNNSRTQWAKDLQFSPIDRGLEGAQVYEQANNQSCFEVLGYERFFFSFYHHIHDDMDDM